MNRPRSTERGLYLLYDLETYPEGVFMLIPIGTKHLETSYLRCRADMLSYAGADIEVTNTDQSDSLTGIVRQAVKAYLFGNLVSRDIFKGHRQIFLYQPHHLAFYLLFFLTSRLVVKNEAHLTLLALDVGIVRTCTTKEAYHHLIQQMFRRVGWREFLFVMLIQDVVFHFRF